MDVFYDTGYLDYMPADEDLVSAGPAQPSSTRYLRTCSGILSGFSCLFNVVIIITVMDFKLKTHLKLVLSLAFSDFFLAGFLIAEKFVEFSTPWLPHTNFAWATKFALNISVNNTENVSITVAKGMNSFLFPLHGGSLEWDGEILSQTQMAKLLNFSEWTEFSSESIFQNKNTSVETFFSGNISVTSPLKIALASAYLIPHITSILTMLFIAICMLISVAKPLHYKMIVSKSRVTVLILSIWGFALAIGGIVFLITFINAFHDASYVIVNAQHFIWYGGILAFLVISILYGVIFAKLRRQKFKHPSRFAAEWKAAVTALSVIVTFAICNMPIVWMSLAFPSTPGGLLLIVQLESVFELLFALNTIMDPVIYSVRLDEVAEGGKKILARFNSLIACCHSNTKEHNQHAK